MKIKKEKLKKIIDKIDKYITPLLALLITASAIINLFEGIWLLAIWKIIATFWIVVSIMEGTINRRLRGLAEDMLKTLKDADFIIKLYRRKYGDDIEIKNKKSSKLIN